MKSQKRIIIFGCGEQWGGATDELQKDDLVIGVDAGAYSLLQSGVVPAVAIGDFDSVTKSQMEEIRQKIKQVFIYATEKDETDLELALNYALTKNPQQIILYWVTGKRLDHFLGALFLLEKTTIPINIRNAQNDIQLVAKEFQPTNSDFKYISIIPVTETATVSLSGFLYPVDQKILKRSETIGISNEITRSGAKVTVQAGKVLVVQSRDQISSKD